MLATIYQHAKTWGPVGIWAALIFYLSSIPGLKSPFGFWDLILRKAAHITEFAILTAFMARAFWRSWPTMTIRTRLAWSGSVAIFYAVSDEWHQSFVPQRQASVFDVGIDALGVLLCLLIIWKRLQIKVS